MTHLEFHPLANDYPMIEGVEFARLVADIKANGLRQPITLHEGKILDGRNRYLACEAAGVEPAFKPLPEGTDPQLLVLSANLHRRHLTPEQRAALVADRVSPKKGRPRKSLSGDIVSDAPTLTVAEAAEAAKVSVPTMNRALKRKREDPAAHEAAKAGKRPTAKKALKGIGSDKHDRELARQLREQAEQKRQQAAEAEVRPTPSETCKIVRHGSKLDRRWQCSTVSCAQPNVVELRFLTPTSVDNKTGVLRLTMTEAGTLAAALSETVRLLDEKAPGTELGEAA